LLGGLLLSVGRTGATDYRELFTYEPKALVEEMLKAACFAAVPKAQVEELRNDTIDD